MSTAALRSDPDVPVWPVTRDRYEAVVGAGLLDGVPVELLEGLLVEVNPMGSRHAHAVRRLGFTLSRAVGPELMVSVQTPLAASEVSEPEPDIMVIDAGDDLADRHPRTAHLVIEVADTSSRTDLTHKPGIYAGAGVPVYWVVDLAASEVVVHDRLGAGADGRPRYGSVTRLALDAELEALGLRIRVADILG